MEACGTPHLQAILFGDSDHDLSFPVSYEFVMIITFLESQIYVLADIITQARPGFHLQSNGKYEIGVHPIQHC